MYFQSLSISYIEAFNKHTLLPYTKLCSAAGLYVGHLGVKSSQSVNLEEVKQYGKYLFPLAIATIAMRILWVVDVVFDVQVSK
jgi:hypothetical protein